MAIDDDLPELAIQSHGIGQESAAIHEMWSDPEFRRTYGGKSIIIVSSDTGDERPATTRYRIDVLEPRLRDLGLPYRFISTFDGYHTGAWANGGLIHQFRTHTTFGAASFPPSCSISLKLDPVYAWLERYIEIRYGFPGGRKRALRAFVERYGKVRMIIGFAKGEESRIEQPTAQLGLGIDDAVIPVKKPRYAWMDPCIEKRFPLMDLGMSRADAQRFVRDAGQPVPVPSACLRCPYASYEEIVFLARQHREAWEEWKEIEAARLANPKHQRFDANGIPKPRHGVKGLMNIGTRRSPVIVPRTLEDFYQRGLRKLAHIPPEELDSHLTEYVFSHGHNVPSKY